MKHKNQHYRQGDVIIERVARLPKGAKKLARENGLVVLAHGEVTGHAHYFGETEVEKYSADGEEYFRVGGNKIAARLPILRRWRGQVLVKHPKFGTVEFAIDDVTIEGNAAVIDGEFALLRHGFLTGAPMEHPDHNTQAVAAGLYRGGNAGASVGQSEYDPEEIRRVID